MRWLWRVRKLLFVLAFLLFTGAATAAWGLSRVSLPPALPQQQTTTLTDANGLPLAQLAGVQNRQPVTINQIPQFVIDAVVSTEDHNFYRHHGLDPVGIARAAVSDLLGHGSLQGASTLTQQYVRNAYLGQQRTLSRKLKEAVLSLKIERQLTKSQILERYLNVIYFGRGAYGIEAASQAYFHHSVGQLTVPEAAFLAGAIRAPEYADPVTNQATAKARRDRTLTDMVKYHKLATVDAVRFKAQPVEAFIYKPADQKILAVTVPGVEYFVSYVTQRLISSYGASVVYGGGLKVRTSLDLTMQQEAYDSVYNQVLVTPSGPAGALVSLDNSGAIKAMVGGRDYKTSVVNLALGNGGGGSGRQPGSTMKAVLLAELIREGYSVNSTLRAPAQILLRHANNGADWTVTNFDNEDFSGPDGTGTLSMIDATKNSVNTVYAQAVLDVSPGNMANMAFALGLGELPHYPSIVLGTIDESVLQMAAAYAVFADGGTYIQPHGILSVADSSGTSKTLQIFSHPVVINGTKLTKADTDLITYCLQQVVLGGTGTTAAFRIPVAGKTGTTEQNSDAWFVGYTPQPGLITAVWMGYPASAQPMTNIYGVKAVTGGTLPADIFRRFMSRALVNQTAHSFDPPPPITGKVLGQPANMVAVSTTTTSSTTVPGATTTTAPGGASPTTLPPPPPPTPTTTTTETTVKKHG